MNSIRQHLGGQAFVAQVRMERQVHKGAFILVEGATDAKRFMKFLNGSSCSIVICFGKSNVLFAIKELLKSGFLGAIGFIDADFDRILSNDVDLDGIVRSQSHDFDLDVMCTPALDRYLAESADQSKCDKCKGGGTVLDFLINAIRPLSALRFANEKNSLRYSLSGLDHQVFFDGKKIDIYALIDYVSQGRFHSEERKSNLMQSILRYSSEPFEIFQLTSGHDLHAALGVALRDTLGSRHPSQTREREIAMHLRLTFDRSDFELTSAFEAIVNWEEKNPSFKVLNR
jgi:hypothetical protein